MDTIHFHDLYQKMFTYSQSGQNEKADLIRVEIERLRNQKLAKPPAHIVESVIDRLPKFAKQVFNFSHEDLGIPERSNCINGAFNFHDPVPHWETYSTSDFLRRIQSDYVQLEASDFQYGDLVVMWSRLEGGSWENRKINVHSMRGEDADFPYGLVFDHVAVRLSEDLVFHKADATLSSIYQIDFLTSAVAPTVPNFGFEMTYHRPKS